MKPKTEKEEYVRCVEFTSNQVFCLLTQDGLKNGWLKNGEIIEGAEFDEDGIFLVEIKGIYK